MAASRAQLWPNAKQARKGVRSGHPELAVECPQCHSAIGRTCLMAPGFWGIRHTVRKALPRVDAGGGNGCSTALIGWRWSIPS
jgi:hypothetical protein